MTADANSGLQDLGDGLYAYLQPGSWGWSNAGLVVDGDSALLVDTLFDLRLTERMLAEMRRAAPAAAQIDTLVNTHANGDHTYGNQLVGDARIVASARAAQEMNDLPASTMAALLANAPQLGEVGEFFQRCFGEFDFGGIVTTPPSETFEGELTLRVGARELRLIEVGPAHTRGDTLVLAPSERVLFTGDILFHGMHPLTWAGPVSNWIAACDRILAMDVDVLVPGHGPLAQKEAITELRAYLQYVYEQARRCHDDGMTALEAARAIALDPWSEWAEPERLVLNVMNVYRELAGDEEPLNTLEVFQHMATLAGEASSH
jgi:cyclase